MAVDGWEYGQGKAHEHDEEEGHMVADLRFTARPLKKIVELGLKFSETSLSIIYPF